MVDETYPRSDQIRVLNYLEHGMRAEQYRGYSWCRICGFEDNGSAEFTDGTYIWPTGLAHYVDKHSVRLPAEFLAHVDAQIAAMRGAAIDDSWWISIAAAQAREARD
jgi:hypothetical protein